VLGLIYIVVAPSYLLLSELHNCWVVSLCVVELIVRSEPLSVGTNICRLGQVFYQRVVVLLPNCLLHIACGYRPISFPLIVVH
jgi:hypothetical protein